MSVLLHPGLRALPDAEFFPKSAFFMLFFGYFGGCVQAVGQVVSML
jgi:hypothetical protein